jgi:hypothetical protein
MVMNIIKAMLILQTLYIPQFKIKFKIKLKILAFLLEKYFQKEKKELIFPKKVKKFTNLQ